MRFKGIFLLLAISLMMASSTQASPGAPSDWLPVNQGIDYQEFYLSSVEGPIKVFVARMDRHNQAVILESGIAQGKVKWKYEDGLSTNLEPVSRIFSRYDQAISFWGEHWGGRNRVAVAINGSYYNGLTGKITQGMVHSGWYAKRYWNGESNSGFAWKFDRSAFIGGCVYHPEDKQLVVFQDGSTMEIDEFNAPRGDDELILYTPQYDSNTNTPPDMFDVEVVVEMTRPNMLLPFQDLARGTVREIRKSLGSTYIQFDHVVLSAQGDARRKLLDSVEIGDEIEIYQKIRNCDYEEVKPDWTKTFASVGMGFHFLKQGVKQYFPYNDGALQRHPRTAIAYNNDYMYFMVVDGRDENVGISIGMTIDELANFARDILGATDGVSLDGGGSSTMVVNGVVKNNPSDPCNLTSEVDLQSYGPQDQRKALLGIENLDGEITAVEGCERYVANSMMMVVVEPMVRSVTFAPGDPFRTNFPTNMRLGPGSNYAVFAVIPADSEGVVMEHTNDLNGVLAKGDYWWKVDFGGTVGWISEQSQTPDPSLTPEPSVTPEPSPTQDPSLQNFTFINLIQR